MYSLGSKEWRNLGAGRAKEQKETRGIHKVNKSHFLLFLIRSRGPAKAFLKPLVIDLVSRRTGLGRASSPDMPSWSAGLGVSIELPVGEGSSHGSWSG